MEKKKSFIADVFILLPDRLTDEQTEASEGNRFRGLCDPTTVQYSELGVLQRSHCRSRRVQAAATEFRVTDELSNILDAGMKGQRMLLLLECKGRRRSKDARR